MARLPQLTQLIDQRFRHPCPRQTGETTAMLALAQQLTASGEYAKEILIQRQDTHLGSLANLLQEERVRGAFV